MLAGRRKRHVPVLCCVVCLLAVVVVCSVPTYATAAVSTTANDDDYYAILGLATEREDATERQIKSAWRQLSKKHHPDLAGEAERQTYQRIQRAYEVLGDRRKRKVYDILGVDGLRKLEQPQQQQAMNPFMQLFGGGAVQPADRGADVNMLLVVPLEDVYKGAAHSLVFTKNKICRACRGSGARSPQDVVKCTHCGGHGRVIAHVQLMPGFVQEVQQQCQHCRGQGKRINRYCPVCRGKGTTRGGVRISVDVEVGVPEGHVITYELEADQQPGQVPGDVLLTVVTAPHPRFERVGDDLHTTVHITLKEALLGFEKTLTHLDGHEVVLHTDKITQHDERVELADEGLPRHHVPSEHGKLYVTYKIDMPASLNSQQVELLRHHLE